MTDRFRLEDVVIRPFVDEHALVFQTWIKTQERTPIQKVVSWSVLARGLHRVIEGLLERKTVLVAEWQGIAIGYVSAEPGTVHYVFVKDAYRRKGVAKKLLEPYARGVVRYTHLPAVWRGIKVPPGWTFDPFAAWVPEAP